MEHHNAFLKDARTGLVALLLAPASTAMAQCTFTPTVVPDGIILCPFASDTLSTQTYDAYQWYKDGAPITGATGQSLAVDQVNDAGSQFSVSATLDACQEMSANVLVDAYMFLFPYVINGGDEPIDVGPGGLLYCEGDTLTLTLGPGFTQNITWTMDGNVIPGATSTTLVVTTTGSYTVSAAPDVCPDYVMGIGVDVNATFNPPMQPDIVDMGDGQLCVYPTGLSTQWYLDGDPLATTDCITMTSSGPYTAFVDYGNDCQVISAPFLATDIAESNTGTLHVSPMPADGQVTIEGASLQRPAGAWRLMDLSGRTLRTGRFPSRSSLTIDVSTLAPGEYLLVPAAGSWRPVRIAVAR